MLPVALTIVLLCVCVQQIVESGIWKDDRSVFEHHFTVQLV